MAKKIQINPAKDGIDRRGFLECMTWAGTGLIWTVSGGVLSSKVLGATQAKADETSGFTFAQISDSHIGFSKEANKDVTATLQEAIARVNNLDGSPEFLIHTGDLSHLSKPAEFDTVDQALKSAKTGQTFFVPGEHDVIGDNGQQYLARYGKGTKGTGWYSFDHKGVHFIGLVNVADLKPGGLGTLGPDQLNWLKSDLNGLTGSTPIVVFAHIPLWTVYREWGWGTEDGAEALSYMKRFGSVTVLNGHIHQTMQKVEGNVSFHTALSTAFPQPKPGAAPAPGPMKVPAERLRDVLGIAHVNYIQGQQMLAIVDSSLASGGAVSADSSSKDDNSDQSKPAGGDASHVNIDNFSFNPKGTTVKPGTTVLWTNRDDMPHNVVSTERKFASPVLDTDQKFSFTFREPGAYPYFCKIHPMMTGKVIVVG